MGLLLRGRQRDPQALASRLFRTGESAGLGPGASAEQPYRVTQEWFELGVFAQVGRTSTERQPHFALAETERAQSSESSELPVSSVW